MFTSIRLSAARGATRIVGVFSETKRLPKGLSAINSDLDGALSDALKTPGFKGDAGECLPVDDVILVGLGKADAFTADTARSIGGRLVRKLHRMDVTKVSVELDATVPAKTLDGDALSGAVVEGMVLGNWRVDMFDGSASNRSKKSNTLTIASGTGTRKAAMDRARIIAESANEARRLGATPPNICEPAWFASEARKIGRQCNLKVSVITAAKAAEMGMGGLTNVGKGSKVPPRLVVLEHKPAKAKKGVKLALVGKTITYDTGGYSLKISNSMKGMKYDKCGGTAVLGAIRAVASLNLPIHAVALLPAAENMVNGEAYRPDDIIRMYNDVAVEVTNTDAEGRLVLADALAYACKTIKPTAIIDAATLTGGVVVGLGHFCAGFWCEDDGLRTHVERGSERSGERVWRLPLWKEHKDFMRARHADIWNSAPSRNAHPIQGAAFLSYFVDDDVPWCHLDIAGVADVESDKDLYVAGPTGYGVRLMTEIAASMVE
ncbi:MAG: leucyl aminopeptidase family protein [Planctomycetota bacterium]